MTTTLAPGRAPFRTQQPSNRPVSPFDHTYVIENGVISISLRALTFVGCWLITIGLCWMGMDACSTKKVTCEGDSWPMVSTIIRIHPYDRAICLMFCFFALAVQQVNVRANFKRLYGVIDVSTNDYLFILGLIGVVSLPMAGYFDENEYKTLHVTLGSGFLGSSALYAIMLSSALSKHMDKLTPDAQRAAVRLGHLSTMLSVGGASFLTSYAIFGVDYWTTPALEWGLMFTVLNYFGLMTFTNCYYASVHPYGKLLH